MEEIICSKCQCISCDCHNNSIKAIQSFIVELDKEYTNVCLNGSTAQQVCLITQLQTAKTILSKIL